MDETKSPSDSAVPLPAASPPTRGGRAARPRRPRRLKIRPGTLPGTLEPAMAGTAHLHVLAYTRDGHTEVTVTTVDEAIRRLASEGVTWINVDGLDAAVLAKLGQHFNLHPLALEDVLNVPQRPKVERYDKHFFMVLRSMRLGADAGSPDIIDEQVSVFFGPGWVITIQERADGDCFAPVRAAIRQGRGRVREAGADYLAYLLLDAAVDAYFPVLEALDDRMSALEDDAITARGGDTLVRLQRLRHDLLNVRRAVWPIREQVGVLQRDDSSLIAAETRVFLRDAYDHAMQALEIVEALRETSASVMEVYLSAQNQRLNEVMKVLTVIATVFIPLTFIASIYGMNFEFMPERHSRWGYPFARGLMVATAGGLILYFHRRGWW